MILTRSAAPDQMRVVFFDPATLDMARAIYRSIDDLISLRRIVLIDKTDPGDDFAGIRIIERGSVAGDENTVIVIGEIVY